MLSLLSLQTNFNAYEETPMSQFPSFVNFCLSLYFKCDKLSPEVDYHLTPVICMTHKYSSHISIHEHTHTHTALSHTHTHAAIPFSILFDLFVNRNIHHVKVFCRMCVTLSTRTNSICHIVCTYIPLARSSPPICHEIHLHT